MSDRLTVDTITSDQLDALQLKAARMEHAVAEYAKLRVELEDTKARAEAASRLGTRYMGAAEQAEAERDGAYRERAHLLAWLAAHHAAVLAPALDIDDEDGWHLLYLYAGDRQMSWHIAPRDVELFNHVERVDFADPRAAWDGHTTDEKYERIRTLPFGEMREAVRTPGPAEAAVERVRALCADPNNSNMILTKNVLTALGGPFCGAGSQAPNAIGNEHCTLPAGHDGRHADGTLTWPRAADKTKEG